MDNHLVLNQMYLNIAAYTVYTFVTLLQYFLTAEMFLSFMLTVH